MTRPLGTVPEVPNRSNQSANKPQWIDEPKPTAIEVLAVNHRAGTVAGRQVAKVGLQERERLKQAKVVDHLLAKVLHGLGPDRFDPHAERHQKNRWNQITRLWQGGVPSLHETHDLAKQKCFHNS